MKKIAKIEHFFFKKKISKNQTTCTKNYLAEKPKIPKIRFI